VFPAALVVDVVDGKDGGQDEDVVLPVGNVDYELFHERHLARYGRDYARRTGQRVVPAAEVAPGVDVALARADLKVLTEDAGVANLGRMLPADDDLILPDLRASGK
jgi:hypothetical protein